MAVTGFNKTVSGAFSSPDTAMLVCIETRCFGCGCTVKGYGRSIADARKDYREKAKHWGALQLDRMPRDRAHCGTCITKLLKDYVPAELRRVGDES